MLLVRLRIATLGVLLAGPPLIAFGVESGLSTLSYFRADAAFDKVLVARNLALAGVELARALPAEAFAPKEKLAETRAAMDRAFDGVVATFKALEAVGGADDTLRRDVDIILSKRGEMPNYRQHVDAGADDTTAIAIGILQPAAGAGLDLVRRLAEMVDDFPIARLLTGLHALLQANDGLLMTVTPGAELLAKGKLDFETFGFGLHGEWVRRIFQPIQRELLAAALVAKLDALAASPDGEFRKRVIAAMMKGERGDLTAGDEPRWRKASFAQVGLNGEVAAETVGQLNRLAAARKAELHGGFLVHAAISALVLGAGIGLGLMTFATLRRLFTDIAHRTRSLAEGDKAAPIPCTDRGDEIGDIARALEVFRAAAIRNDELEAQAIAQRAQAEQAKRDAQAAAERDAEAWMEATTRAFADGLRRLAGGDLGFELREKLADRFEALREDFNVAVRKLREALATVDQAAGTVGGRSADISHSAAGLAAAAARQSEALGSTAQTLQGIAAEVQAMAERAGAARSAVGDTRTRAERADDVMRGAIGAMERIDQSSKQIAQINGVVDEIAFQTNLLALNAAVEAARAGESGKGFAVVAQEVRELALRSASAAKEINQLVSSTTASIGDGVRQVNGAAEQLRAIGEFVARVDADVGAMADAAREQAKGLSEVSVTLSDLDRSTRANAEMVQGLTAAGSDLASDSYELNELMSRFQIAERAARKAA